jgi:UDP-glucose 4-epimerase
VQALLAEQVPSGAVNVGRNQAVSLLQLLQAIEQVLGRLPAVTHVAPRAGDIRHSRADNRRLLAHYSVPLETPLVDGLACLLGR